MRYFVGTVIIFLYSGFAFYIGWNIKALLHSYNLHPRPIVYWLTFFFIAFAFIIGRLHPLLHFLSLVGNYWMFILQYGIILCVLANFIIWITPLSTKTVGTGALAIFVVLFAVGTYFAYTPTVHKTTITIDKEGEPMRVVMASDFHLGVLSHKGHLKKFVQLSNEQQPDLVMLVGDIVDDDPTRYIENGMKDVMSQLQSTYGVYGVLGNHEYYGNKINEFNIAMEDSGVTILMDETTRLPNGVYLTGREDVTNKNRLPVADLKPEDSGAAWFVMNHTPDDLTEPKEAGVDFHVSGHTHKGQMWPNQFITERIFDLGYGHERFGKMHAIVSSGFGFWGPPMRIGSQAELWVIDIEFTNNHIIED